MAEYFNYLFRISWPAGSLLIILFLFVMIRLYQKAKYIRLHEWDEWGIFILVNKLVFWLSVLAIYLLIFFHGYPDWLVKPAEIQGNVENVDFESSSGRYYMEIKNDAEKRLLKLWVDETTFRKVELESKVKVKYLPLRKEVYSVSL